MNFSNIKKIAKQKKINLSDIAIKIGMTQEGFSRSLSDENLKVTTLEKIAEILNIDVREFFDESEGNKYEVRKINESKLPVPPERQFMFPIGGQAAQAGITVGFEDWERKDYIIQCRLPMFRESNARAFAVVGDSMHPTIMNGELAICLRVMDISLHPFKHINLEVYVVVTDEGIYLKRVKQEKEGFTLISDNAIYTPRFVPISQIFEIWKVDSALRPVF